MKFITKDLMEKFLNSKTYEMYYNFYCTKKYINKNLLQQLLNENKDLYYIFLKINITLYHYNTRNLNRDLKNHLKHKGKKLYINDVFNVMNYYYSNFSMCQKAIKKIIYLKLVPNSEIKLLKLIISRNTDKELISINLKKS